MLSTLFRTKTAKEHWEAVYRGKSPQEMTWYQAHPECSLRLLEDAGGRPDDRFIDVGGGASTMVDHLIDLGFGHLTVLDISAHALEAAVRRLGPEASQIRWIEADITKYEFVDEFDIWHDRAVYHFLTEPDARSAYLRALAKAVRPGGHVIISTFGIDGPAKCSGLPVVRYSPASLQSELGAGFRLIECLKEMHVAPSGHQQHFICCLFRKKD